ncbi:MAG TPA: hypothetical protein VHY09_04465 [Candidatus Methylacidiphilales bacterium]|jgi:hypothetical protein|nr:hypothetical protein [Candidatus Methylacidiphilales bacterium]
MARIPDRFDLWVRKARESADPARQVDLVLGALVASIEVYFVNVGTKESPRIARGKVASNECALVFTDAERIGEFLAQNTREGQELAVIASPTGAALAWCVENRVGAVINPSTGETAMVAPAALAAFVEEWKQRGGRQAAGFWIPNMTSEEEDFWQENGL